MIISSVSLAGEGAPVLDCYVLDPEISSGKELVRPAVVICPGGGYLKTATREREVVAARLMGMGCHAFVLRYHTYVTAPPAAPGEEPRTDPCSHYPLQVVDLMRAMTYVRAHAKEWRVDSARVYAMGFSAGGHIVGSLIERFDDEGLLAAAGATAGDVRPRGALLCYPMVDGRLVRDALDAEARGGQAALPAEHLSRAVFGTCRPTEEDYDRVSLISHVRPDMPPLFVWQPAADELLHAEDTVAFVARAVGMGVPCELHLFQRGIHGMSLCDETSASKPADIDGAASAWVGLAQTWLMRDARGV